MDGGKLVIVYQHVFHLKRAALHARLVPDFHSVCPTREAGLLANRYHCLVVIVSGYLHCSVCAGPVGFLELPGWLLQDGANSHQDQIDYGDDYCQLDKHHGQP